MKLFESIAIQLALEKEENLNYNMSLEEVTAYLNNVSQEGFISDSVDKVKSIFTSLMGLFKSYTIEGTAEEDEVLKNTVLDITKNILILKKYPDQKQLPIILDKLGNTIMGVPNGFKGDLPKHIDELYEASVLLQNMAISELQKFTTIIANYVTNADYRNTKMDFKRNYNHISSEVKKAVDKQHNSFNYNANDSGVIKLSKLIDSYKEILKLEEQTQKLSKVIQFKDIMLINSNIQGAVDTLDVLIDNLKQEDIKNKTLVQELANYTKEIAKLCEVYSSCRFYIESAIKMALNITTTLSKAI